MGKKLKVVLGAVVLLGIGGAIGSMGEEEPTAVPAAVEKVEAEKPKAEPKAEPKKEKAGITMAEFEKIQNGMTYEEVVNIIGAEGEIISETGQKGEQFYTVLYQWEGESGFGANANATFQDGKMVNKAQFGLE